MIEAKEVPNSGRNKILSIDEPTYWVPVVDGKEYSHVAETQEMALLLGLGLKFEGLNTKFAGYAGKMLGIRSAWTKG